MGQYLLMVADSGQTLKFKMYSIGIQENDLQEWEDNTSVREFANFEEKEENKVGSFLEQ